MMHLSSLRLHGFKSFAAVTQLRLQPGLTAIVGPNGSGKSNIADAIRWVLGEQSLRALRGVRSQDVIFSGNGRRRSLGFADVSLTLDNTDQGLPLEFSEVSLSRRVYQSGEGEFAINGSACRLRDIHDLLMDSGLGRGGLCVVSQGEVDAVLSGRPEDRRLLIEEVARTAGYRVRKRKALERLEAAAADRQRVLDLLEELKRQEEELARQAEQAERHRRLSGDLKNIERQVLVLQWARLYPRWVAARARLGESEIAVAEVERTLQGEERRYRELLAQRDASEESFTKAAQDLQEQERALEGSRHQQELLQLRLSRLDQEEEQITEQEDELQRQLSEEEQSRDRDVQRWREVQAEAAQLAQEVAHMHRSHQTQEEQLEQNRQQLESLRSELVRVQQEALTHEGALRALEGQQTSLEAQSQRLQDELAEVAEEDRHLQEQAVRTADALRQLAGERKSLTAEKSRWEDELARAKRAQLAAQQTLQQLEDLQRAEAARARALGEMEEAQEGYQGGVRAVMKARSRLGVGEGIIGPVGQLLEVAPEWQTAVETALGGAIQHIVTVDDRAAKAAIAFLKREKSGRATFLPLNLLRVSDLPPRLEAVMNEAEVVGLASDLVEVTAGAQKAVRYLLGRTLVVRTLDAAVNISRRLPASVRIVTPEGDLVSPGGAVSGGAFAKDRRRELLGRRQTLLQLERSIKQREETLRQARERVEAEGETVARAEAAAQRVKDRLQQLETEVGGRSQRHDEIAQMLDRLHTRRRRIQTDLDEGRQQSAQVRERSAQLHSAWQEAQGRVASLQQAVEKQRAAVEQARLSLGEAAPDLNEAQARLAALQQQQAHLESDVKRGEATLERTQRRLVSLEEKRAELTGERRRLEAEQSRERERFQELEQRVKAARQRLDEVQRRWQMTREEVRTLDEQLATLRSQVSQQRQGLHREETAWQNLDHDMATLRRTAETLGISTDELARWNDAKDDAKKLGDDSSAHIAHQEAAVTGEHESNSSTGASHEEDRRGEDRGSPQRPALPALQQQARRLRQELEAMPPVNMAAPEQLQQVQQRVEHLQQQFEDLAEAEVGLRQAIAEIDGTSARLFKETLAAIQNAFQQVFLELFGDGEGRLTLTDPENPLTSGVDVHIRLPGKPARNLLSLSGGERALIAIALLLAMMRVRPVPFCVLDEVDASLDEANLRRFTRLLQSSSRQSQMIAITHRRPTMEVADCLYGVTMREAGISSLVSLRLEDVT